MAIDPNSVQDYAVSKGLVKEWNPQNAAKLFESQGLGTASQYLSAGKNNSAYNSALLAKLKGYSGTTGKGISGGASVGQNKNVNNATNKAQNFVNPPAPNTPGMPNTPPTPQQVAENPQLKAFEDSKKSAYANIDLQYKPQIDQLHTDYASLVAGYQEQKKKAIAGAEAEYARANPYGSGSDKEQFIQSVSSGYDKMLSDAANAFHGQMSTLTSNIMAAKQNVDTQYQQQLNDYKVQQSTNFKDYLSGLKSGDGTTPDSGELMDAIGTAMASGKTFEQAKSEIQGALEYAGRVQKKADMAEAHQQFMEQHTLVMEGLAIKAAEDKATGKTSILSPTEIDKLKTLYPKATINYGMNAQDATTAVQNSPKFELKSSFWGGDSKFEEVGITAENLDVIRSYLNQGATPDDIWAAIPGITPEQKNLLLNSMSAY